MKNIKKYNQEKEKKNIWTITYTKTYPADVHHADVPSLEELKARLKGPG